MIRTWRSLPLALALLCTGAIANPGDITLQLMASPAGFATGSSPGHAFACIALHLNSSVKEDCVGFYLVSDWAAIKGAGTLKKEFEANPARFSNIASEITVRISEEQRRAIYVAIGTFNDKHYSLIDQNCIDLVAAVARAAGLNVPQRSVTQTPVAFLDALKAANVGR